MRNILIAVSAFVAGFMAWYFAFATFYESWFPYYYEDYLSYIFGVGSLAAVAIPLCLAHFKFKGASKLGYYRSFTWFGLLLFVIFALITIYMFSTGILLDNSEGVYKIVPADE